MKIAVAMSGGVDSSTAAAVLRQQGHEIVGFTLQLWNQRRRTGPNGEPLPSRCCSLDDVYDARTVAAHVGFPFYVLNMEEEFEDRVVFPFVRDYLSGRTPIPCVSCNTHVKFRSLLEFAEQLGFEKVATGHYARIEQAEETGRFLLKRGVDATRDQSYFLFELTQDQLARTIFPLGHLSKKEVRRIALEANLAVAHKGESQEICFVPDGNYARFVEEYRRTGMMETPELQMKGTRKDQLPPLEPEGEIVTSTGEMLGRHQGIHRYTVGQRRGLNLAVGQPLYVIRLDRDRQRLIVGSEDELLSTTLRAERTNWISIPVLTEPLPVTAKVRYRHKEAPATIEPLDNDSVCVRFDEPQRAFTPGQAVVFYQDEVVVGGGWICDSQPEPVL
ncbi:MAG: tRNA 2-thiouridine(34) synthase MnmA [Acidobacteria bacterium]|nr:tRNA 2-thiouridine(34) synthase MnmA [Acidobacteriota bacterium]